jgi:hypothetical protein
MRDSAVSLANPARNSLSYRFSIARLVIFDFEAPHGGSLAWDGIDSPDDAVRGVERRRFGMKVASHVADPWQGVIQIRSI